MKIIVKLLFGVIVVLLFARMYKPEGFDLNLTGNKDEVVLTNAIGSINSAKRKNEHINHPDLSASINDFDYTQLKNGFKNPPNGARPKVYWWWLNGNIDTAKLMEELKAMKDVGVAGVDIFDIGARAPNNPDKMIPGGPAFMGEQSLAVIIRVIKKATEYGMEVDLNLASSWNAGGSWIAPEHAGKSLYHSIVKVSEPGKKTLKIPFPVISPLDEKNKPRVIVKNASGKPVFHREVAMLAIPGGTDRAYGDTSKIINVSKFFNPSTEELTWTFPSGDWEIQRFVCSSSGEQLKYYSDNSAGPIIDHFDSAATRAHLMYFINKLQPALGDFRKTALKSFYLASYEATGSVWTETLPALFRELNGYDLHKLLPGLINAKTFDSTVNRKFKHDFDLTISELMIRNHYGKAKEIANKYGLQLISESGGPGPPLHNVPVEGIKALGALDIPRGEFWNKHAVYDKDSIDLLQLVKEVSAAAHMYGRKVVEEESFTSFEHWTEGPSDLRPLGDRAFCEGMNRVVIHGFSHNPSNYGFPGVYYHAGTHYNNKNLWWSKSKPFLDYLSRISFVMQETKFIADVLYYNGDNFPNIIPPKNTRFRVGQGYDYDIINTDILLNKLMVKNGLLMLPGGAGFKVLSLGNMENANAAVVKKLGELARAGAVITGSKPVATVSLLGQPAADVQIKKIADELWFDPSRKLADGQSGKLYQNTSALEILKAQDIGPDFTSPLNDSLDFIHSSNGDADFYFVRNTTAVSVSTLCTFRQTNRTPEIWNPVTGEVSPVSIYSDNKKSISIPVSFAAYQSFFFVFRKAVQSPHFNSVTGDGEIRYTPQGVENTGKETIQLISANGPKQLAGAGVAQELEGPWTLNFRKEWGAPESVQFEKLISWTESSVSGIKYYSGPVVYTKKFTYLPGPGGRVYLDLGDLSKVAELWLNGKSLGVTWTKPFSFDITNAVKAGENDLKIEVVNTWSNRLSGDAITGEKFTSTNLGKASQGVRWGKEPLLPSGLFGPVTVRHVSRIKL